MGKDWTLYESEKEKFKALFPARVRRECRGLCSDDGTSPGTVLYISKIGFLSTLIYQINATRVPPGIVGYSYSSENFLKGALEVEIKSIPWRAELKSYELTIFKGYSALGYEVETSPHGRNIKGIMVLVKNTVYNLIVWFWSDHEPEFEKFINSFEILR